MITMCGLKEKSESNPQGDIEIRFVGLRPGEKLYEELVCDTPAICSEHPRILRTKEYVVAPDVLRQEIEQLLEACASNDTAMMQYVVKKLVRGYSPSTPVVEQDALTKANVVRVQPPVNRESVPGLSTT